MLFLPANLRSRTLVAPATGSGAAEVAELFQPPLVDHHWAAADGGLALVAGHGAARSRSNLRHFVLLIEEPELYLSPHAQRHLYRLLRELAQRGQPDPLLDARAGLPQRRQARGARARPPHADRRDVALPARAARGGGGVPRALGVRQRPRRALPRALRRARRGPHREADVPARLRRARRRPRQGGDPRARVRRQGQHAALRAHLQRLRRPVRHRPRPRRAARPAARRVGARRQPADPRGRGQPAHRRAHAGLRGGLRAEGERPRPQAAEGVARLQRQRRGAASRCGSRSRRC